MNKTPEYKAPSREYLSALTSHLEYVKLINPTGKIYEKFYNWLIENETVFQDKNQSWPPTKTISQIMNLDYSKVKKSIIALYNDIIELNDKEPEKFKKENQHLCHLRLDYLNRHAYFHIGMNVIPRINDTIKFSFTQPVNGGSLYYVEDVSHTLTGSKHEISISLGCDEKYLYLQLLKEKAYLQGDISLTEYLFPLTKELKQDLLRLSNHL
jgi:hypothetical protein